MRQKKEERKNVSNLKMANKRQQEPAKNKKVQIGKEKEMRTEKRFQKRGRKL